MAASEEATYFVVNNIPGRLRSADLRNYFSQFIESKGFVCFHYRHRPEVRVQFPAAEAGVSERTEDLDGPGGKHPGLCCCVVSVRSQESDRFMKMYSGNQWIDSKGNCLRRKCLIRRVKVSEQADHNSFPYKTKIEMRRHLAQSEHFTMTDLKGLPELNPPSLMPSGNVGTPVTVFLQLIQSCRLPPRLIRKLGLTFPKTGSNRRYGNVPYLYYNSTVVRSAEESVFTAGGVEISGPGGQDTPTTTQTGDLDTPTTTQTGDLDTPTTTQTGDQDTPTTTLTVDEDTPSSPVNQESQEAGSEEELSGPDDDDDRCEEWERHEALHDDVTSQERSKERLYEEEIELKWEKGGSGLVFYTDAQFWHEEEGDFDEQTADDWDVDMSVYYDRDGGDMDSRDYVRMRSERRLREGLDGLPGRQQKIGNFERFTKGFGRRVMEKQGWKDGESLGSSQVGITDALESEGQHPNCKRGFGYHGEKLSSFLPLKKPRKEFHISTIYDKPKDIDKGDELLRRQPSTSMKHKLWRPAGSTDSTR
ncbi:G patch domain-containing protein 3 isoform X2 [Rhinichthys klamathensis goyatoka]|uniref:G patch domain-containing protein 3 isoform X2 n=1 Tax=Rhinichthys klamathensis goyatoka TaxID=3034132 RepID=UPI0024B48922|nr:G patch domain-containing protein 3 isoform X2 [Rhinichthys klamathensis goyatoka]